MKEYEKLAQDWYNNHVAFDGLKEAYVAGFLKAREIALEMKHPLYSDDIDNLGEKEV